MPYHYNAQAVYRKFFLHFSKTCRETELSPVIAAIAHRINLDVACLTSEGGFPIDRIEVLFDTIVNPTLIETEFDRIVDEEMKQYCLDAGMTIKAFKTHQTSIQSLRHFFTGNEFHIIAELAYHDITLSEPNKINTIQILARQMVEKHLTVVISDIKLFQFSSTYLFRSQPLSKRMKKAHDKELLTSKHFMTKEL